MAVGKNACYVTELENFTNLSSTFLQIQADVYSGTTAPQESSLFPLVEMGCTTLLSICWWKQGNLVIFTSHSTETSLSVLQRGIQVPAKITHRLGAVVWSILLKVKLT